MYKKKASGHPKTKDTLFGQGPGLWVSPKEFSRYLFGGGSNVDQVELLRSLDMHLIDTMKTALFGSQESMVPSATSELTAKSCHPPESLRGVFHGKQQKLGGST